MKTYDQISFSKKSELEVIMHVNQFLHTLLSPVMHLKRLSTLTVLVLSTLKHKKLSVTQLGRGMETAASEKNNIKRSDRFLSNKKLGKERQEIYATSTYQLIGGHSRPRIIVHWSPAPNALNYILRAALILEGRALSLYEEVHPKAKENNSKVHELFLSQLKKILPLYCRPIIVTDAGFCVPF